MTTGLPPITPITPVALQRTTVPFTPDQLFWDVIKDRTEALSFNRYVTFLDSVLSDTATPPQVIGGVQIPNTPRQDVQTIAGQRNAITQRGVFNGDAYQLVKAATELFVMMEAGRLEDVYLLQQPGGPNVTLPSTGLTAAEIQAFRAQYLDDLLAENVLLANVLLPHLEIIRRRLGEVPVKASLLQLGALAGSYGILRSRITSPIMLELMWNYWIEQSYLVQTISLIALRFQNVRRGPGFDPLGNFELDPLRPLSNILWGYVQDEINRLSVNRRAYEYAHGLGLQLVGKAIPELHPADVRTQFLPAFHDVLRLAWIFFREDDDTTIHADAFPLLNALRELHFVVAEGAHNQYGDLPMRARIEMLLQQWILARPEMKDFLRGRTMMPYPEEWMDRVDTMKTLLGWSDASVLNYNDLAVNGEKVVLAVRYGRWSDTDDANQAANWARAFRPEIQRYTHALKVVSGIDLSVGDVIEVRTETERLQHGIITGRVPSPGGTLIPAQQPTTRTLRPRPGVEHMLRPAVQAPAQSPVRGEVDGAARPR
jgi:hypothetical protein